MSELTAQYYRSLVRRSACFLGKPMRLGTSAKAMHGEQVWIVFVDESEDVKQLACRAWFSLVSRHPLATLDIIIIQGWNQNQPLTIVVSRNPTISLLGIIGTGQLECLNFCDQRLVIEGEHESVFLYLAKVMDLRW